MSDVTDRSKQGLSGDKIASGFPGGDENIFESALMATVDAVVITDDAGKIQWVNPAWETLTGYELNEVINKDPSILKSGKQDPAFYKTLWETISQGLVWKGELWNKKKDGTVYLEDQSITPVKEGDGHVTHFVAIKRDITGLHQIQSQLNMARRFEAISQLTAGVAHNFNNKLASILGFADLVLDDVSPYKNEEINEYLNEMITAGMSARDVVRQMMAFSHNEFAKKELVDISLIINEAVKFIESSISEEINIITKLGDVPFASLDPVSVHEMIMSLVGNAANAISGKGEIVISTKIVKIDHVVCSSCHKSVSGKYVSLSVRDDGKGMTSDEISKIFLPFYTTRQYDGGTGLGLSSLHGTLHDIGGHVYVDAIQNEYTDIRLYFPLGDGSTEYLADVNKSADVTDEYRDVYRILIVDDEKSIVNYMSEVLKLHGHQITTETNSMEALASFTKHPDNYDLLITDLNMPRTSGVELIDLMHDIRPQLPTILITGNDDSDHYAKSVNAVLRKPFETKSLLQAVHEVSRESRQSLK